MTDHNAVYLVVGGSPAELPNLRELVQRAATSRPDVVHEHEELRTGLLAGQAVILSGCVGSAWSRSDLEFLFAGLSGNAIDFYWPDSDEGCLVAHTAGVVPVSLTIEGVLTTVREHDATVAALEPLLAPGARPAVPARLLQPLELSIGSEPGQVRYDDWAFDARTDLATVPSPLADLAEQLIEAARRGRGDSISATLLNDTYGSVGSIEFRRRRLELSLDFEKVLDRAAARAEERLEWDPHARTWSSDLEDLDGVMYRGVEQGDPHHMLSLGSRLLFGEDGPVDHAAAAQWYRKALHRAAELLAQATGADQRRRAQRNVDHATQNLTKLLKERPDLRQEGAWTDELEHPFDVTQRKAREGDPTAMIDVGVAMLNGYMLGVDVAGAADWLRRGLHGATESFTSAESVPEQNRARSDVDLATVYLADLLFQHPHLRQPGDPEAPNPLAALGGPEVHSLEELERVVEDLFKLPDPPRRRSDPE